MVAACVEEGGQRGVKRPVLGLEGKTLIERWKTCSDGDGGGGGCDEGYLCPPHAEERRSLQDDAEATRHRHKKGKKRVEEEEENGVDGTLKRHQRH